MYIQLNVDRTDRWDGVLEDDNASLDSLTTDDDYSSFLVCLPMPCPSTLLVCHASGFVFGGSRQAFLQIFLARRAISLDFTTNERKSIDDHVLSSVIRCRKSIIVNQTLHYLRTSLPVGYPYSSFILLS